MRFKRTLIMVLLLSLLMPFSAQAKSPGRPRMNGTRKTPCPGPMGLKHADNQYYIL